MAAPASAFYRRAGEGVALTGRAILRCRWPGHSRQRLAASRGNL